MQGSFCLSGAIDVLEVIESPPDEPVRADFAIDFAPPEKHEEPQAPPRKRRPLSPVCPYCSVDEIPKPLGFLRSPWVQRAWPVCVSLTVHAAVILFGLLNFDAAITRPPLAHVIDGVISTAPTVSGAAMIKATDAPEGLLQLAAGQTESDRETSTPRDPIAVADPFDTFSVDTRRHDVRSSNVDEQSPLVLGVNPNSASSAFPLRREDSLRSGADAAAVPAGSLVSGSAANPSAPATDAKFFGVSGNARAVVYVCDASGSMLGTDEVISMQLQRAVLSLHPTQEFNVIFFSAGSTPLALNPRKLVSAEPNNKVAACNFAKSFSCGGKTNAIPALQTAMRYKPDLLYLVTDGAIDASEGDNLLRVMRSLNSDHVTKVNVILICGAASVDAEGYPALRRLAEETGGTCRVVNPNNL